MENEGFVILILFSETHPSCRDLSCPQHNHNLTSRGQPSRYLREAELEKYMQQSGGGVRLGTKIDEKLDKYRTLCPSNPELILK